MLRGEQLATVHKGRVLLLWIALLLLCAAPMVLAQEGSDARQPAGAPVNEAESAPAETVEVPDVLLPRTDTESEGEKDQRASTGWMGLRIFLFLSVLAAGALLWRYYGPKMRGKVSFNPGGSLRILESKSLGGRQYLVVAEWDGQRILLGIGPGQIRHLCSLGGDATGGSNRIEKSDTQEAQPEPDSYEWIFRKEEEAR